MRKAKYIWEVTVENEHGNGPAESPLVILAASNVESAIPKARKLLAKLSHEDGWQYRIVKIKAAGTVDAF